MKKLVSAAVTLLLSFVGLTVAAPPAMAWTTPPAWDFAQTIELEVGQYTVLDWGCGEPGITNVSWNSGTLPDGLTIDSSGYVSGTPTTPGDSNLSGYTCTYSGGSATIWNARVTLRVSLPASPTPTISVTDVGDPGCSAWFTIVLPMAPEPGSVSLEVSNGLSSVVLGLADLTENTTVVIEQTIPDFESITSNSNVVSMTPSVTNPFSCGDTITATLSYTASGRSQATATESATITGVFVPEIVFGGTLDVANLDDSACTARITGSFEATADPDSVRLQISNGSVSIIWNIRDYEANEPISIDLPLRNMDGFVDGVIVLSHNYAEGSGDLACGDTLTAQMYYTSNNMQGVVSDLVGETITSPPPPSPAAHLTLSNANDASCNLVIEGLLDTAPDLGSTVGLTINNGTAFETWTLRNYNAGETISLNLSLVDLASFVDGVNVLSHDQSTGSGTLSCGDTLYGQLDYSSYGLPYWGTDNAGVTVTQFVEPPIIVPTVSVNASYVGGETCQIDISGSYNFDVDAGSAYVAIGNNRDGAIILELYDLVADAPFSYSLHLNDQDGLLGLTGQSAVNVFAVSSGEFNCGDIVTVSAYASKDAETFDASTSPIVTIPQARLSVTNLDNASCELRIVGTIPVQADANSIYLDFISGTAGASALLGNYLPGTLIDLTFSMDEWDFNSIPYIQDAIFNDDWSPECGDSMTTILSYEVNGVESETTVVGDVVTSRPVAINPATQASVVAIPSEQCLVVVSGLIPVPMDTATLVVGDFSEPGRSSYFELVDTPIGTPFSITIPMLDPLDASSDYLTGEMDTDPDFSCGSMVSARIDGMIGDYEFEGVNAPAVRTDLKCFPGKYQSEGACVTADRGYFVSGINALEQTACPAGYNTFQTGSTSPGDCYKVLTQTISNLKPPKAMKFKKQIGLPVTTTARVFAEVTASGSCTVAVIRPGGKVAGKKVKVTTLAVTATSTTGTCVLRYSSAEYDRYGQYSKVITIKVNKNGR